MTISIEQKAPAAVTAVKNQLSRIGVVMPASHSMRERVRAEYAREHGLDLSDDDRADWLRSKSS